MTIEEEARKIRADPLTRLFARHIEVELGDAGNVKASNGTPVKFDKNEREVMGNKTPDVCVQVYRLALALHMRHRFTRVHAVDGSHNQEVTHGQTPPQRPLTRSTFLLSEASRCWLRARHFPLLVGPDAFLLAVMQPETGQPAAPRHPPPV